MLNGLTNLLITSAHTEGVPKIPEALQAQILQTLFDGMLRVPQIAEDEKNICQLAVVAAPLVGKYAPDQQAQVRPVMQACAQSNWVLAKDLRSLEASQQAGTDEEVLKQADATGDLRARMQLKIDAAGKAANAHDFQRALDILDGFSTEERADSEWPIRWHSFGIPAIFALYDKHDLQGIQQN